MANFKDLVQIRYSCRNYSPIAIDRSIIEQLLETAHFAPSATNAQPWRVFVFNTPESLAKVRRAYNREWIATAPVVLMLCAQTSKAWTRADGKNHADIDLAILADHLTLAAADMGLATCWVCNFDAAMLSKDFNLEADCKPVVLLPLGAPATDDIPEKKRKDVYEFVEWM
ncbi:MAG: nitroreductase family protein [Salinivirgaceae bacterium]|nr:nitroreductase family protein [Salinivirgaceae bacterium]